MKALFSAARVLYQEWRKGNFSIAYPSDLDPPAFPKLANLVGALLKDSTARIRPEKFF
jgi:hypothetical protein